MSLTPVGKQCEHILFGLKGAARWTKNAYPTIRMSRLPCSGRRGAVLAATCTDGCTMGTKNVHVSVRVGLLARGARFPELDLMPSGLNVVVKVFIIMCEPHRSNYQSYVSALFSLKASLPTTPEAEALYPDMTLSKSLSAGLKPSEESQELWLSARANTPADAERSASYKWLEGDWTC